MVYAACFVSFCWYNSWHLNDQNLKLVVYTCQQQPQSRKCDFFLWATDAEVRERTPVHADSNDETDVFSRQGGQSGTSVGTRTSTAVVTPSRNVHRGLLTPRTEGRSSIFKGLQSGFISQGPSRWQNTSVVEDPGLLALQAASGEEEEDEEQDEVEKYLNERSRRTPRNPQHPRSEPRGKWKYRQQHLSFTTDSTGNTPSLMLTPTPRKTARTGVITSPGKRELRDRDIDTEIEESGKRLLTRNNAPAAANSFNSSDTISTPHPSKYKPASPPPSSFEISTTPTPARYRNTTTAILPSSSQEPLILGVPTTTETQSDLALEALTVLDAHVVTLPERARNELVALLNRHDMRTKGIMRGRDITRAALKRKEERIRELERRVGEFGDREKSSRSK